MANITTQEQRPKFSVMVSTPAYQKLINNTLKDPNRAQRFVAAITSAVAVNPALQECDPATVLSGALLGESLGLSPSPQLGQYYLVPYENRKKGCKDAQFQMGYKGYIQLALRSGCYKRLNVIAVKAGELLRFDPLTEDIELRPIPDDDQREKAATIGYLAMFEYLNGFRKTLYWSREKMINHADRYSPAFSKEATFGKYPKVSYADYCAGNYPKSDEWKYSSFWYKNFDAMAYKTMLRQLISKWGIMSVELQMAFEEDSRQEQAEQYLDVEEPNLPSPDSVPDVPAGMDQEASEHGDPGKVGLNDL